MLYLHRFLTFVKAIVVPLFGAALSILITPILTEIVLWGSGRRGLTFWFLSMCPTVECILCSENVYTAHCMKQ